MIWKIGLLAFLSMSIANAADPVLLINQANDPPARTVFIQLSKVENALQYEVEITPVSQKWSEPYVVKSFAGAMRVRLTPSSYQIRTRSIGRAGMRGPWSDYHKFAVPMKSIEAQFPADNGTVDSTGQIKSIVTLEWPPTPNATYYYVEVRNQQGQPVKQAFVSTQWLRYTVTAAEKYTWCHTPATEEQVKSGLPVTNCKYSSFKVRPVENNLSQTLASVQPHAQAESYQFEVVRYQGTKSLGDAVIIDSHGPELKSRLEPGEYELRARAMLPKSKKTSWSSPKKFFVPHPMPEPVTPLPGNEVEAGESGEGELRLKWLASPGAERYRVFIFDEEKRLIRTEATTKPEIVLKVPEDHKYYWAVTPFSVGEPDRPTFTSGTDAPHLNDVVVNPYIPYTFSTSEDPAAFYAWGRYVVSSADYYSESFDDNAIVRQVIQAGQLEFATGYWHRRTRLGLLAQVGMQHYRTVSSSSFQKSAALNLGYRLIWEGDRRARVWLGYGYRDIPSIRANPTTNEYSIQHLSSAGPQVTFSFMDKIWNDFGYQLHGKFFWGLQDVGTPNGKPQNSAIALSASATLTYKINLKWKALAGYTYQLDSGSYESADTPGAINSTKLTGHYFTFGAEMALSDPKK